MNTIPATEQTVRDVVQAFLNNSPDKGPKKNNEYRYYHCHDNWNCLKCKKVDGPSVMSSQENTKLLFVKSYIPEQLDKYILKYKWIPENVIIEKST